MTTYWIFDMQATKEVAELNLKVLEKYPRLLGANEFLRSIDTERYLVFNFDANTADTMELGQRREGVLGPFSSREEAETIARRLNAVCD